MEETLPRLGSPVVLCHNDLLCKNIIYDRARGPCAPWAVPRPPPGAVTSVSPPRDSPSCPRRARAVHRLRVHRVQLPGLRHREPLQRVRRSGREMGSSGTGSSVLGWEMGAPGVGNGSPWVGWEMGSCWDGKWDPLEWEMGSPGMGNGIYPIGMGNGILWSGKWDLSYWDEKWDPVGMENGILWGGK